MASRLLALCCPTVVRDQLKFTWHVLSEEFDVGFWLRSIVTVNAIVGASTGACVAINAGCGTADGWITMLKSVEYGICGAAFGVVVTFLPIMWPVAFRYVVYQHNLFLGRA